MTPNKQCAISTPSRLRDWSARDGKTTLATAIGQALHVPVLSRDLVKTGMHVSNSSVDPDDVHRFAATAFDAFFAAAAVLRDRGCSVVIEAAFHSDPGASELAALCHGTRAFHLRCHTTPSIAASRYRDRYERGERHPAHADAKYCEAMLEPDFPWARYEVGLPEVSGLDVDTTNGYRPSCDAIIAWITGNTSAAPDNLGTIQIRSL